MNPPVVNPPVENPKPIKAAVSWKSLLTWKYVATGDSERKYAVADSCGGTPKELSEIPPEKKDRRTDAKYLRILNYNVQWLFLTKGVVKKHNNAKNFPWTVGHRSVHIKINFYLEHRFGDGTYL